MALRCLLFCSDEGTAAPIREVLGGLGVEGEHCTEAVLAVEKVSSQPFQIVIIDWDLQPEAGLLLSAARERKASERALTLAIVSDDRSVPQALQAGANSVLRKPIQVSQAKDTLKTARDLLRARQDSAANVANGATAAKAAAATAATTAPGPAVTLPGYAATNAENPLRAGEFVQSTTQAPGAHFDTESEMEKSIVDSSASEVDPLAELEPMAAAVQQEEPEAKPFPPSDLPRSDDEPRGLAWYLNRRAGAAPAVPAPAAPAPAPPASKPELMGFDQPPIYDEPAAANTLEVASMQPDSIRRGGTAQKNDSNREPKRIEQKKSSQNDEQKHDEQKNEAELFAYIDGENQEPAPAPRAPFRLGSGAIIWASALAACAVVAAPQAPWHPQVRVAWAHGQRVVHGWLNPQLVTTPQAPTSHESFGRAGDEYKLPVAETIPDATTDPSQIRVTPVVDPTAKKPNDPAGNPNPTTGQPDGAAANPGDPFQAPNGQPQGQGNPVPENQPPQAQPAGSPAPAAAPPAPAATQTPAAMPPTPTTISPGAVTYTPTTPREPVSAQNSAIPSSLKSQMASMTPDASGNKAPEAAMSSIEPVKVAEAAERELLVEQPAVGYPASARGQQGTVILQVLIGRDGSVQDAKFLQGSLAFARAAIDGVRLWRFKPYTMNGRPVSVQVPMTISFKPGQ